MGVIEAAKTVTGSGRPVFYSRNGKPRRDIGVGDVLVGVLLTAAAIAGLFLSTHNGKSLHPGVLAVLFTAGMTLPVVFARRAPLGAAATYAAASLAGWAFVGMETRCGATLPAAFWIASVIGLRVRDRSASLLGLALVILGICAMGRVDAQMDFSSAFVMMAPIAIGFWFGCRTARARADTIRRVREQNEQILATRERTAQLAVHADRAQIADGLDQLLHQRLSGMASRADSGRARADQPAAAQEAFAAIADEGRDTLAQLRQVVGSLRSDAPLEPQPDLSRLSELVAHAGGRLRIEGTPRPLPSGVELSGYRIVEQLLSAAGADRDADVSIRFGEDELQLHVSVAAVAATGPDRTPVPVPAAAERAALHGGSLIGIRLADRQQWVARLPVVLGHAWS